MNKVNLNMKKIKIVIIIILIMIFILLLFPKRIGYGGGYVKAILPDEERYSESFKCMGFTYRLQPGAYCLDCGYGDYCIGIKYRKECSTKKFNSDSKQTELISTECRYKPQNIIEWIKLYFNAFDLF